MADTSLASPHATGISTRVVAALAAGVAVGLLLGDLVAPLELLADGFIKLLEMTVLPYVFISIVATLGAMQPEGARRLVVRAGAVLLALWAVGMAYALLLPLAFPAQETGRFFSTSLVEPGRPFDFVALYIPANPFRSLADGVVPAVVLFSVIVGVAMMGYGRRQVLLDVLDAANGLVRRAAHVVERLMPFGMFAIAAHAAGTIRLDEFEFIGIYLIASVAVVLLVVFWVLPGLVAALTPIRHTELIDRTRSALLTAFMAGDLFIVLPVIAEAARDLIERHQLANDHHRDPADVIVPASFSFPHIGTLIGLSFIVFAAWLSDVSLRLQDYPRLAVTGVLASFGSLETAVPFLLDHFRIPSDAFALFEETHVFAGRFGALAAVMHTAVLAILGSAALAGALRVDRPRLIRFGVTTLVLTVAVIGGLRAVFSTTLRPHDSGSARVYGMEPIFDVDAARAEPSAGDVPPASPDTSRAEAISRRGVLRVCTIYRRMPYAYMSAEGQPIGFDVEMAHRLAHDLGARAELVPVNAEQLPMMLAAADCDLAMAGIAVTPAGAASMRFSQPYLDETLAFVVKDHLRHDFMDWDAIRALGPMRVGVPGLQYYIDEVRERAPALNLEVLSANDPLGDILGFDAVVLPAERGAVLTLLRPEYAVAVPSQDVVKVPLAYPLAGRDHEWATFVDTWIELKRRDGTIDRLYRHWILGQELERRPPRWSVVGSVMGRY